MFSSSKRCTIYHKHVANYRIIWIYVCRCSIWGLNKKATYIFVPNYQLNRLTTSVKIPVRKSCSKGLFRFLHIANVEFRVANKLLIGQLNTNCVYFVNSIYVYRNRPDSVVRTLEKTPQLPYLSSSSYFFNDYHSHWKCKKFNKFQGKNVCYYTIVETAKIKS